MSVLSDALESSPLNRSSSFFVHANSPIFVAFLNIFNYNCVILKKVTHGNQNLLMADLIRVLVFVA